MKWYKRNCNKIIEIVLTTKYGQQIIVNGDIWEHDLQNTLSNYTAVTIISIITTIITIDIQQQRLVMDTPTDSTTTETIILEIKNTIIKPSKVVMKEILVIEIS